MSPSAGALQHGTWRKYLDNIVERDIIFAVLTFENRAMVESCHKEMKGKVFAAEVLYSI
jgi:hypothetical protein